jgi:hypothetical protein
MQTESKEVFAKWGQIRFKKGNRIRNYKYVPWAIGEYMPYREMPSDRTFLFGGIEKAPSGVIIWAQFIGPEEVHYISIVPGNINRKGEIDAT